MAAAPLAKVGETCWTERDARPSVAVRDRRPPGQRGRDPPLSLRRLRTLLPAPRAAAAPPSQSGPDPVAAAGRPSSPGPAPTGCTPTPPAPGTSDSEAGLSFRQEKRSCLSAVSGRGFFSATAPDSRPRRDTSADPCGHLLRQVLTWDGKGGHAASPSGRTCQALGTPRGPSAGRAEGAQEKPESTLYGGRKPTPWHPRGSISGRHADPQD